MPPFDTTRPWRWPTEAEWVVHEVTRGIVSWAALARNEGPQESQVTVRRASAPAASRFELTLIDFVVAVDGFVVEGQEQMSAVLTFTDDPKLTLLVQRQKEGFLEITGAYRRWKYGPPAAKKPPVV